MTELNSIVTCPYDEVHRIRKSVLPYHLVRCSVNNTSSTKKRCPFDTFHIIDEIHFESHVANCASSGNIIRDKYSFEPLYETGTVSLEMVKSLTVPVMQDWKEENVKPYDPWKNTQRRDIIRCVIGGSKSVKKHFKLAERERVQALNCTDITTSRLSKCMKLKVEKKYANISQLVQKMRRLYLEDLDALIKNLDISKLCINGNTFEQKVCLSEIIEKVLVQKFNALMLYHLQQQIL